MLGAPKNGAPSAFILGYSLVVPPALALSVHGNLHNTKRLVQLTKLRTGNNRDSALWVIESPQPGPVGRLTHSTFRYIVFRNMARKATTGPATDPEILILSSLCGGPKHGYAIMTDVHHFAGVKLGPGTLYGAITRLVDAGWMEPLEAAGRQRPYRITPGGLQHLQGQLERMRRLATLGLRRLQTYA